MVGLCWSSTGTKQWHIHHYERKKKNESDTRQTRHPSFHLSKRGHLSPRGIINCHTTSSINKNMKSVPSAVNGSDTHGISMLFVMSHETLLDWSKVKPTAVRCRAGGSQADSDLFQPLTWKAPLTVAAWFSARWQRDFNRQSYLSQNKLLQICETNIE